MIHVDALDFSEWHSEEVKSFFWRSVYICEVQWALPFVTRWAYVQYFSEHICVTLLPHYAGAIVGFHIVCNLSIEEKKTPSTVYGIPFIYNF